MSADEALATDEGLNWRQSPGEFGIGGRYPVKEVFTAAADTWRGAPPGILIVRHSSYCTAHGVLLTLHRAVRGQEWSKPLNTYPRSPGSAHACRGAARAPGTGAPLGKLTLHRAVRGRTDHSTLRNPDELTCRPWNRACMHAEVLEAPGTVHLVVTQKSIQGEIL